MTMERILKTRCYILIREKRRFFGDTANEWRLLTKPGGNPLDLSSMEAKYLREDEGLVEVHKDKDGSLWELPDRPFFRKYNGYYAREEERERKMKEAERQRKRDR